MKRILVTGGTGFIGSNLVEYLIQGGHQVHLFVREEYQDWRIKHILSYLQLSEVNLLNQEELITKVKQIRPDWVFHLAAYGAYSWQDNLTSAIQTNFLSTVNLVEACRKVGFEAFINTGSSSEYGFKNYAPKEDEFLEPTSYYALTKASSTLFCQYTGQRFNLPLYTLRLYSVFGPYEDSDRLIPKMIINGFQGKLPSLVRPDIARDFIYVEDVNSAYKFVASSTNLSPGSIYNVGTGQQTSLQDVVKITRDIFSIRQEPVWGSMENRAWDTNVWVANNEKLRAAGWISDYDFKQGLLKTIEWFRKFPSIRDVYY